MEEVEEDEDPPRKQDGTQLWTVDEWLAVAASEDMFLKMEDLKPMNTYTIYVGLDQGYLSRETLTIERVHFSPPHMHYRGQWKAETDDSWSFYDYNGLAVTGSGADRAMLAKKFACMPNADWS